MYYKITDKESNVFQQLYELLKQEKLKKSDNEIALKAKIGLTFKTFLGEPGQQKFNRLPEYYGFKFLEPSDLIDERIWKKDKEHPEIYIPNRRTKAGREMLAFLDNGLKKSYYGKVFEILKLKHDRRFTFPAISFSFFWATT
jgi:hypothetical protein